MVTHHIHVADCRLKLHCYCVVQSRLLADVSLADSLSLALLMIRAL
jgi:hypothetical protein